MLYAAISDIEMSANEFASRVGVSSGFISGVYTGTKKPPTDRLKDWAKFLRLRGAARQAFLVQGHLEHATPELRKEFNALRQAALKSADTGKAAAVDVAVLRCIS